MRLPVLTALLTVSLAACAQAAEIRPFVTLSDSVVHLSDLFTNAGPQGERVLGPAPAPGGHMVVEAAQLEAIARQFGVRWMPSSRSERVTLERPGRPFDRDAVLAALRPALEAAGLQEDDEIELLTWEPPLVPVEGTTRAEVSQVDYDAATGRFTAALSLFAESMPPLRSRVSGRLRKTVELPVTTRRLLPGEVIGAGDLQMVRLRGVHLAGEPVRLAEQAVGLTPRHAVPAGQPLLTAELVRPPAITRGAPVNIVFERSGIWISGQGRALESGAVGDRIHLLNPASRAVIEAEVIGAGRVRVAADASAALTALQ